MKPILVYTPEEAKRNEYVVRRFAEELGTITVSPDFRGTTPYVVNRSNDYHIAEYYENLGVPVFNAADFTRLANDKQACYDFMQAQGIEIMPTRYSIPPFVKKPGNSHGGQGVVMCHDAGDYDDDMVCQMPASDLGKDVRVWVLDNKIVASVLRSSTTDFRSNYCLGGKAELYTLSNEERNLTEKIIDLLADYGGKYYAVDYVFHNDRAVFNEIEDAVGARMLYDLTKIDIIGDYIGYIKNCIKK